VALAIDHGLPIRRSHLTSVNEALASGALTLALVVDVRVLLAQSNLLGVVTVEEVDACAGAGPVLEIDHVSGLLNSHRSSSFLVELLPLSLWLLVVAVAQLIILA